MNRSRHELVAVCHWCKATLDEVTWRTFPQFTEWPLLPAGTKVGVCGPQCKEQPSGAVVVAT